jgi:hypothetical protein
MDTTAHRILKNARDLLVDGLVIDGTAHGTAHGLSRAQQQQLQIVTSTLWHLIDDDPTPPDCQTCATPLPEDRGGRPRRYCSNACRQADYRARGGALASDQHAWAGLSQHARLLIIGSGLTVADYIEQHFADGVWRGDECGCIDDRCIGHHHVEHDNCGCLPVLIEEALDASQ